MKIHRILFGSDNHANEKFWENGWKLEKVQHILYEIIMIYYIFHNSTIIVQSKRMIIIGLHIVQ